MKLFKVSCEEQRGTNRVRLVAIVLAVDELKASSLILVKARQPENVKVETLPMVSGIIKFTEGLIYA